jgi:hypothetical protein
MKRAARRVLSHFVRPWLGAMATRHISVDKIIRDAEARCNFLRGDFAHPARRRARQLGVIGSPNQSQSAFTTRQVPAGALNPHPRRAVARTAFVVGPMPTPYEYPRARLST